MTDVVKFSFCQATKSWSRKAMVWGNNSSDVVAERRVRSGKAVPALKAWASNSASGAPAMHADTGTAEATTNATISMVTTQWTLM